MGFALFIVGIILIVVGICQPKKRFAWAIGGLVLIAGLAQITIRALSGVQSTGAAAIVFFVVGGLVIAWALTAQNLTNLYLTARYKQALVGVGLIPVVLGIAFVLAPSLTTRENKTLLKLDTRYIASMASPWNTLKGC